MNADGLVSLTDYCLDHDIAPEDMLTAFNAAMDDGMLLQPKPGQWTVYTDAGERIPFADYVATLRQKESTPDV